MVKLKKYKGFLKLFVIFLTVLISNACSKQNYQVSKIEGKQIPIDSNFVKFRQIEDFIKPYRDHIDADLDSILAFCPETLNKNEGKWQTAIGNLMADACVERGNLVFEKRDHKKIDLCILNFGGIRAPLPKGNITARNAFEIMPFENSLVVLELKGKQITEMLDYIISEKKAHPLSGITFTISKTGKPINVKIQGQPFDENKIYYVATNDYLANGGDSMNFFKESTKKFDLEYKLRNVLIDYFKTVATIPIKNDLRITEE